MLSSCSMTGWEVNPLSAACGPYPSGEVWPREQRNLTPWLAENLDVLEDQLGLELVFAELEHRVGRYELDL
jgi:hypothetical protein